jgi:hypothetical protein
MLAIHYELLPKIVHIVLAYNSFVFLALPT